MDLRLIFLTLLSFGLLVLCDPASFSVLKRYTFNDIATVRQEWNFEKHPAGWINSELEQYVDSNETAFLRNGHLVIRAFRRNGTFFSARLSTKQMYTPTAVAGKKLRIEFTAKVPTLDGSWPALWMVGDSKTYGQWPACGEIDLMEWVHNTGESVQSTLHWKSHGSDWSTQFAIGRENISRSFITYGVEYSNHMTDAYIQFYTREDGKTVFKPKVPANTTWLYNDFTVCDGKYTADASRCSFLAPFDNQMKLIVNVAVGGWGGKGVQAAAYDVFDKGVETEVSSVTVFQAEPV